MDRVNSILNHEDFKDNIHKNDLYESERRFCKHDLEHLLSVARIAYIINLEENLHIDKEIIYACALLHDLGRNVQYEKGIPHEEAGAYIAKGILKDSKFKEEETCDILCAIRSHRVSKNENPLNSLMYRADKLSRNCFNCKSFDDCNWDLNKKNLKIFV